MMAGNTDMAAASRRSKRKAVTYDFGDSSAESEDEFKSGSQPLNSTKKKTQDSANRTKKGKQTICSDSINKSKKKDSRLSRDEKAYERELQLALQISANEVSSPSLSCEDLNLPNVDHSSTDDKEKIPNTAPPICADSCSKDASDLKGNCKSSRTFHAKEDLIVAQPTEANLAHVSKQSHLSGVKINSNVSPRLRIGLSRNLKSVKSLHGPVTNPSYKS